MTDLEFLEKLKLIVTALDGVEINVAESVLNLAKSILNSKAVVLGSNSKLDEFVTNLQGLLANRKEVE